MSGYNETNCKTFTTAAAVVAGRLVTINSSGQANLTGAGGMPHGVVQRDTASGDPAPVRLLNAGGTFEMMASGAITAGARVYAAASGKISATQAGQCLGQANEAATADGDIIEVLFGRVLDTKQVSAKTADYTITKEESGAVFTNLGAAGAVVLTLPQDAVAGTYFIFAVMAAQALRIDPGAAGAVYIAGAKQTDDKYVWADDEAESLILVADGNGDWVAVCPVGTWGVEA